MSPSLLDKNLAFVECSFNDDLQGAVAYCQMTVHDGTSDTSVDTINCIMDSPNQRLVG